MACCLQNLWLIQWFHCINQVVKFGFFFLKRRKKVHCIPCNTVTSTRKLLRSVILRCNPLLFVQWRQRKRTASLWPSFNWTLKVLNSNSQSQLPPTPVVWDTQLEKKKKCLTWLKTHNPNHPCKLWCDPALPSPVLTSEREREKKKAKQRMIWLIDSWRHSWAKWTWRVRPKESRRCGHRQRSIQTKTNQNSKKKKYKIKI